MNAAADWLEERRADDQQRFLSLVAASFLAHVAAFGIVTFVPPPDRVALPDVVRVDLVSLPASAPAPPQPVAPPAPPAPKKAPPPPAPAARPKPPPPKPKEILLPKEAPAAVKKPEPAPKPVPKKVEPRPVEPTRPEPIEYEDALSQLREELGEEAPPERTAPPDVAPAPDAAVGDPGAAAAAAAATQWMLDVRRHLTACWITPPEFLNRGLATGLQVRLTELGVVLGDPGVTHTSGDPFFDDNAVRAVVRCSPLPAPPDAGTWRFVFRAESR